MTEIKHRPLDFKHPTDDELETGGMKQAICGAVIALPLLTVYSAQVKCPACIKEFKEYVERALTVLAEEKKIAKAAGVPTLSWVRK